MTVLLTASAPNPKLLQHPGEEALTLPWSMAERLRHESRVPSELHVRIEKQQEDTFRWLDARNEQRDVTTPEETKQTVRGAYSRLERSLLSALGYDKPTGKLAFVAITKPGAASEVHVQCSNALKPLAIHALALTFPNSEISEVNLGSKNPFTWNTDTKNAARSALEAGGRAARQKITIGEDGAYQLVESTDRP